MDQPGADLPDGDDRVPRRAKGPGGGWRSYSGGSGRIHFQVLAQIPAQPRILPAFPVSRPSGAGVFDNPGPLGWAARGAAESCVPAGRLPRWHGLPARGLNPVRRPGPTSGFAGIRGWGHPARRKARPSRAGRVSGPGCAQWPCAAAVRRRVARGIGRPRRSGRAAPARNRRIDREIGHGAHGFHLPRRNGGLPVRDRHFDGPSPRAAAHNPAESDRSAAGVGGVFRR